MTLFETATKLQLRLQAASEADTGDAMLSRGRRVRDNITSAAEHLEAVQIYRVTIGRTDTPPLSIEENRQAVRRFEAARSSSGPKAFQQPSADALLDVLTAQTRRVDQWVKSTWEENFLAVRELLERVDSDDLHGSPALRAKARSRALTIEVVRRTDPVRERATLEARLNVEGLNVCLERVNELIEELKVAIVAIDRDQAAMTPEVRAAIQRATSPDGLPLREVTPELMAALQSAGVLDDLVVRRL